MPRYTVSGLALRTNQVFPELTPSEVEGDGISFQVVSRQREPTDALPLIHRWYLPNGQDWLSIFRSGSDFLIHFPAAGDFLIHADAKYVEARPLRGIPLPTVRHLFLNQVLPLVLTRWGKLVLHAGAVLTPEGAVAFVGATGLGKSTLTASFCQAGFLMLCDDGLVVEEHPKELLAVPSYPGLRLWPDAMSHLFGKMAPSRRVAHYTRKLRLGPDSFDSFGLPFCPKPAPLRRLYFLVPSEEAGERIAVRQVSGQEAFEGLLRHSYVLDPKDRERIREQFDALARAASRRMFRRLCFPRCLAQLPQLRTAVLADVGITHSVP